VAEGGAAAEAVPSSPSVEVEEEKVMAIKELFELFVKDGSGEINSEEVRNITALYLQKAYPTTEDEARPGLIALINQRLLSGYDADGDAGLSLEEFQLLGKQLLGLDITSEVAKKGVDRKERIQAVPSVLDTYGHGEKH